MVDDVDQPSVRERPAGLPGWLLALACGYPTLATWCYFELLAGRPEAGPVYALAKLLQFGPALWLLWRARLAPLRRPPRALLPGLAFGAAAALAIIGLTRLPRLAGALAELPQQLEARLAPLGLSGPAGFIAVAVFYTLAHSLLEEIYWRWLVHGGLEPRLGPAWATLASSLAFTAHHVLLLWRLLAGQLGWVALASLGVALGGAVWARLYQRSGSLWSPWLSHACVDAALMLVGGRLLFG